MNPPKTIFFGIIAAVLVTGILVGGSSQQSTAAEDLIIPGWVKNNAAWWSNGEIADADYASGIEYMIEAGIVKVPGVQVASAQGMTDGQPFDELWEAINQLQTDFGNLQTSDVMPGPQGEQGPQGEHGPQGDSNGSVDLSGIESRLAALENMDVPQSPLGRETIYVSCEPHETLIHGGWTGSVGLKPIETFQTVLKTEAGNDRDTQKITFENTHDVILTGRVHALCATLVP